MRTGFKCCPKCGVCAVRFDHFAEDGRPLFMCVNCEHRLTKGRDGREYADLVPAQPDGGTHG